MNRDGNSKVGIQMAVDAIYEDMQLRPQSLLFIEELVPAEMKNDLIANPFGSEYVGWKMVPSNLSDEEIQEAEIKLSAKLPIEYKWFVQYKFFVELHVHNNSILFHGITNEVRLNKIVSDNLENFYSRYVIDQGYIAIADFYDYGWVLLNSDENDASVYVAMYDSIDRKYYYASSLTEILSLDPDYANNFIENYNKTGWK